MANHAPVENPVSEEAFTQDRVRMFNGFVSATTFSIVSSVIILAAMYIFLIA